MIINIDMDGVVADFNAYASNILNREIGWEGRDLSDKEWGVLASIPNLYFHLPLIEQSVDLVRLAVDSSIDVRFLTAIPRRKTIPTAEQDKRDWLQKYFPGIPMEIGPYSKDKQKWASPGDILIDDKHSNIIEWESRSGIAIHHVGDYNQTIKQLKHYLINR